MIGSWSLYLSSLNSMDGLVRAANRNPKKMEGGVARINHQ